MNDSFSSMLKLLNGELSKVYRGWDTINLNINSPSDLIDDYYTGQVRLITKASTNQESRQCQLICRYHHLSKELVIIELKGDSAPQVFQQIQHKDILEFIKQMQSGKLSSYLQQLIEDNLVTWRVR